MRDFLHIEERLLAEVVQDDVYAALRSDVRDRCIRAMRERREGEEALLRALQVERPTVHPARSGANVEHRTSNGGASADARADYPRFLESVRDQCVAEVRRPKRRPIRGAYGLAAAAAALVLVGTWFLPERTQDPGHAVTQPEQESLSVPVEVSEVAPRSAYVVTTRPAPPGVVVRTAEWASQVEIISDDELLDAIPGLALARVGIPQGGHKIIVNAPGLGRVVHVN